MTVTVLNMFASVTNRNDNMLIPPCRVVELLVRVASGNLLPRGAVESSRAEGMAVPEAFWPEQGWGAEAPSVGAPAVVVAVGPQLLVVLAAVWASLHSPCWELPLVLVAARPLLHSPCWELPLVLVPARPLLHSPYSKLVVRASLHRELLGFDVEHEPKPPGLEESPLAVHPETLEPVPSVESRARCKGQGLHPASCKGPSALHCPGGCTFVSHGARAACSPRPPSATPHRAPRSPDIEAAAATTGLSCEGG